MRGWKFTYLAERSLWKVESIASEGHANLLGDDKIPFISLCALYFYFVTLGCGEFADIFLGYLAAADNLQFS